MLRFQKKGSGCRRLLKREEGKKHVSYRNVYSIYDDREEENKKRKNVKIGKDFLSKRTQFQELIFLVIVKKKKGKIFDNFINFQTHKNQPPINKCL